MTIFQLHNIVILQFLTLNYYAHAIAIRGPIGTAVNFVDESEKQYNFVVAIERKEDEDLVCTGSLITRKHVLSAYHCLGKEKKEDFRVIVGSYNHDFGYHYNIGDVKSFRQYVKDKNIEGEFSGPQDIAIYTLRQSINFEALNLDINFMPLTEKAKEEFYGKVATIVGWGGTDDEYETVELQIAHLRILTPTQCKANAKMYFNKDYELIPERFCSNSSWKVHLGNGDGGGPLIYNDEIIGIAEATYPRLKNRDYHEHEQNLHMVLEKHHRDFVDDFRRTC